MDRKRILGTGIRLFKHTAFSLFGTVTDTIVLWLCSDYLFKGYAGEYLLSPFISFECATLVNFLVASRFVWLDRIKGRSGASLFHAFLGYNASCTGVFFFKMLLLLVIERITKLDVVWCNLLALCISGLITFTMNDLVIFRRRKDKASHTHNEEGDR